MFPTIIFYLSDSQAKQMSSVLEFLYNQIKLSFEASPSPSSENIEDEIFSNYSLQYNYTIHSIKISSNHDQSMKAIYIKSFKQTSRVFYLGHGFGGTSLMYFPLFQSLLEKGSIVLWENRGMGLNKKSQYSELNPKRIYEFYQQGLLKIFQYFQHKSIVIISHSFGAYISLRFLALYEHRFNIQKCILLSPIGITPKLEDYKNNCRGIMDCLRSVVCWFGWNFKITYRGLLKSVFLPIKRKILQASFSKFSLSKTQTYLTVKLFTALTETDAGSERYFYEIFEPRVLPKQSQSFEEIIEKSRIKCDVYFCYGGKKDWVDKQGASRLCQSNQNFQYVELPNCGHMLPLHVQELKEVLSQILNK